MRDAERDPEAAWVAVTIGALLALVRAGISLRDLAPATAVPDGPALERMAHALDLQVIGAYRLSDGQKVWLICEEEQ
ncbi:MAG TPA: hypothetical protein VIV65_09405 [Gemmatimonadaceae bacterium]|jgi:hypothetical protein